MKHKAFVALLLLLIVVGQQVCCYQHALKIEKIIEERKVHCIVGTPRIH